MICLEVSEVSDDRVQDALTRLAADQEGSLPGLLGFLWTHASRGEISGRLEVEKQHLAPTGFLHAATVVALADTACGHGCPQSLPEGGHGFRDCGAHWYGARGRRHLQRCAREPISGHMWHAALNEPAFIERVSELIEQREFPGDRRLFSAGSHSTPV